MENIQIHLMLLFIKGERVCQSFHLDSNTSHVIVYHCRILQQRKQRVIQIHLMLLFIAGFPQTVYRAEHIQIHLMLLFIRMENIKSTV